MYYTALNLEEKEKVEEATKLYKEIEKKFPKSRVMDDVKYRVIKCLEKEKNYSKMQEEIKKFLKDFPSSKYINEIIDLFYIYKR